MIKRLANKDIKTWKIHAAGGGAMVVLTLLAYLVGLRPLLISHGLSITLRSNLQDQEFKAAQLSRTCSSMEGSLLRIRRELEESPLKLQGSEYRNERLALLTELAAMNGLDVDVVQTTEVKHDEYFDMVPIQLRGTGRYPDCAAFLHHLNEKFPDTGVKSFTLTGRPGFKSTNSHFRFEMIWYASPVVSVEGP